MLKPKLLVHASQARTIDNPCEVERLLGQGWLLAKPKPKTKMAARMRLLRNRRTVEGWVPLSFWLSPGDVAAVKAALRSNESYAELLIRLVRKQSLL
ncbi:hypothetical protein SAMN04489798_2297 [Pseudomonas arsenicoxydans]|uniref:Uncharacterized protein n=1 Tax=Pseudomonas arsenicoxydans TaxID=702115 RepID=A0A1H0HKQ6_9PSED|nr:hypothetical protein [Pseudomonas arsenicoxydans]SDO19779.1 hypothetical protein SAMN04489798_2297 [Pseudomonas arsenicoxydans]